MPKPFFLGLDLETTGSDPPPRHQLIQVGAKMPGPGGPEFVSDVGYPNGTYAYTEEALKVNRFTIERIEAGPSPESVDREFANWLNRIGATAKSIRPIGWNVASFDVIFVRWYFPQASAFFSYQSVDLNAVCFTLAEAHGRSFHGYKDAAKAYARKMLGVDNSHDAGFDASCAVLEWEYLQGCVRTGIREVLP